MGRRPARADVERASSTSSNVIADDGVQLVLPHRVGPHPPRPRQRASGSGPGRGSAAGCAVAYCLRITDLDPIRYDLLFERFLNPSRISMPDIDMDFDSRYRDEMIRYAAERYGRDHVAQIITFGTIKARNAVRDAARVLGFPYAVGDRIAKAMPPLVMGRDTPLKYCFEQHPKYADGYKAAAELRAMYDADPDVKKVVDVAKGLEGLKRSDGIHAAAVVITKEPLTEYLPVQRKPETGQDPAGAGRHAVRDARRRGARPAEDGLPRPAQPRRDHRHRRDDPGRPDPDFDIDAIPLDDPPTLELLQRATGIGVFQLEGAPMRALMRSLAPTSFDDVAALVALYRPGPMAANMHNDYADRKNGRKPIEYLHPDLEELLGDTYGLMIYQESVMRVAQKFAGYSLADADNLRKACGKKIRELIAKEREKFVDGCERTGYGAELGTQLFDIIEPFADYAFNKSHAFGYGLVAYQTAYLKAHYPVEYLACLLTSVKSSLEKAAVYIAECRAMGIKVLPPDINRSVTDFAALAARRGARRASRCRRQPRGDHVRAVGGAQRRARAGRPAARRARRQRPVRQLPRLRRAGARAGAQQARRRIADQGRRLRLARPSPQGPARRLRADHRHDADPPPRARARA